LQYAQVEGKKTLICTGCIRTLHKAPRKKIVRKTSVAATA
jgi:hypothetical protein